MTGRLLQVALSSKCRAPLHTLGDRAICQRWSEQTFGSSNSVLIIGFEEVWCWDMPRYSEAEVAPSWQRRCAWRQWRTIKIERCAAPRCIYTWEDKHTHTHTLLKSCWVLPGFVYERGYRTWNFNFRWCLPPCTLCTPIVFITKEMQLHYVNRATIMPFDRSYTPLSTSHRKWQFEFLNRKNYVAIRSHFTFRLCFNTLHTTCFTSPGRLAIFGPEVILKFWICYWCVSVLTMPPAPSCCFMSGATHREESLVVVIACERFFFQWDRCLRLMSKWNMILLVYFSTYNSEAFNAFHIICCCIFVAQASQVVGWISLCLSWLWSQGVARRGARCGVPWLQLGLAGVTGQHRVGVSCM